MADEYANTHSAPGAEPSEPPPRPPFLRRLWMVFVQPGELHGALARNPAWFPMALFVATVVAGAGALIIPVELYQEMVLQGMQEGADSAEAVAAFERIPPIVFRALVMGFGFLAFLAMPVVFSVVTYVIFVFIRGDDATFKQHLAIVAHSGVITAVSAILNGFVNARTGDVTGQLSVGTFFPFLPEGYVTDFLGSLDLFGLWTAVIVGIGMAAADRRRSAGSSALILVGLMVVLALVRAAF